MELICAACGEPMEAIEVGKRVIRVRCAPCDNRKHALEGLAEKIGRILPNKVIGQVEDPTDAPVDPTHAAKP